VIEAIAADANPPAGVAETVVVPAATPLMGTLMLLDPAGIVTEVGTDAMAIFADARRTRSPPAGATADELTVRFPVVPVSTLRVSGLKLTVQITSTPSTSGA
jgi:hypothetical protein